MLSRLAIRSVVSLGFACAALASPLAAQRPDFSGTWVRMDSVPGRIVAATGDAGFPRGDMGDGWGSPLTIAQTAERLRVDIAFFSTYDLQPRLKYSFALDGTESKNTIMVSHASVVISTTSTWEGATLVLTNRFSSPPGAPAAARTPELRQALSLDASGRLVIESRRHGAGGVANTIITTFAKR